MGFLKKLVGAPNDLFSWIGKKFVISWLNAGYLGKHGPALQKVLNYLKGKKTIIASVLGLVTVLVYCFVSDAAFIQSLGWLSAVLVGIGLTDKALHRPGRPAWAADSWVYMIAAEHSGQITSALAAALGWIYSSECHTLTWGKFWLDCSLQGKIVIGLGLFLFWIGVIDDAFISATPKEVQQGFKNVGGILDLGPEPVAVGEMHDLEGFIPASGDKPAALLPKE